MTDLRRLILWDIDGTLAYSGGVATIFERAVEEVVGGRLAEKVTFSGKTDRQITEEFLALVGSIDPAHPEIVLTRIEATLAEQSARIATDGHAFPGAHDAIEALGRIEGVTQSVLTGNVPANARLKLAAFGLDSLLDLKAGAYGRQHNDRSDLLPLAWANQSAIHGRKFSPDETWIVGDTPNDYACASAGGAHCLLVGTGRFRVTELASLGADATIADLTDTARVVEILTGIGEAARR